MLLFLFVCLFVFPKLSDFGYRKRRFVLSGDFRLSGLDDLLEGD